MYILIGLGNPGKKYAHTRHNTGKILAAWLKEEGKRKKEEGGEKLEKFEIVETDCFMNSSGDWLKSFMNHKSLIINHLIVAHDDLDLRLGEWKIHFGRGPRLHKGILSIEQALGTKNFWRVRIGVDNRAKGQGRRAKITCYSRSSGKKRKY